MATQGVRVLGADLGGCTAASCAVNSVFRVDRTDTGSAWQFNWLDADGSVVRAVDPSREARAYLVGSYVPWWNLYAGCWAEPRLSGAWVCPARAGVQGARLDVSVRPASSSGGAPFTVPYEAGYQDLTPIGWTSLFADAARRLVMTKTEGTCGVTGDGGWYAVFQPAGPASNAYAAPRRLVVTATQVALGRWVYWTSCWPVGATLTVTRSFAWSNCQAAPMRRVGSRATLMTTTDGGAYFVDAAGCLHLKIADPGRPWQLDASFEREGLRVEEVRGWFDHRYEVVATGAGMSGAGCDAYFCPLPVRARGALAFMNLRVSLHPLPPSLAAPPPRPPPMLTLTLPLTQNSTTGRPPRAQAGADHEPAARGVPRRAAARHQLRRRKVRLGGRLLAEVRDAVARCGRLLPRDVHRLPDGARRPRPQRATASPRRRRQRHVAAAGVAVAAAGAAAAGRARDAVWRRARRVRVPARHDADGAQAGARARQVVGGVRQGHRAAAGAARRPGAARRRRRRRRAACGLDAGALVAVVPVRLRQGLTEPERRRAPRQRRLLYRHRSMLPDDDGRHRAPRGRRAALGARDGRERRRLRGGGGRRRLARRRVCGDEPRRRGRGGKPRRGHRGAAAVPVPAGGRAAGLMIMFTAAVLSHRRSLAFAISSPCPFSFARLPFPIKQTHILQ